MKLSFLLHNFDQPDLRYQPWDLSDDDYVSGYPSWILYKDGKPVSGIANDSDDENNVVIRHIQSIEPGKGHGCELIKSMLGRGIKIKTGEPGYNSISPSAYHLFNKINDLSTSMKIKSIKIGPANNNDFDYKELDGKDVQHFKWEKIED